MAFREIRCIQVELPPPEPLRVNLVNLALYKTRGDPKRVMDVMIALSAAYHEKSNW